MDFSVFSIQFTSEIEHKLKAEHDVTTEEVEEAFFNSSLPFPVDNRAEHKTIPPTRWFIADTFDGRLLKIVFLMKEDEKIFQSEGGKIRWP